MKPTSTEILTAARAAYAAGTTAEKAIKAIAGHVSQQEVLHLWTAGTDALQAIEDELENIAYILDGEADGTVTLVGEVDWAAIEKGQACLTTLRGTLRATCDQCNARCGGRLTMMSLNAFQAGIDRVPDGVRRGGY